ncbi:BRCA2 and CDKN1A-interacting protein isoform X3 [Saccopteryx bilineata]|uniref:BRCA2 and CDKN1A-interacting protein isoform X3 n=1 Tax=Saccopteryx bilineata TaxID=59482 RepID=UPI003390133A
MASRSKRRAVGAGAPRPLDAPVPRREEEEDDEVEDQDGEDEDSDDEDDEEDEVVDEEVTVEFEAYSISDNDHDGIKKLLQQLFLKAPVNTAELTDLLIQQNHIGSVIKQTYVSEDSDDDDEDEIFGFISLLSLAERKGTQCAKQIKELVLSCCEKNCEKSVVEQLHKLLNDTARPVGFLLSERFINVPPQIALPMHRQLQVSGFAVFFPTLWTHVHLVSQEGDLLSPDLLLKLKQAVPSFLQLLFSQTYRIRKELAEAHEKNKSCGKCHFYLMISKTFVEVGGSSSGKKRGGRKQDALMFANAEEEFFYEALLKFSYSVQEQSDTCLGGRWSFDDVPMKPLRTVMLIPRDEMSGIMGALEEHLST